MKPAFSASDAALEGFSLLRRQWRTVLGWAVFNLLALAMLVVVTVVVGIAASAVGAELRGPLAVIGAVLVGVGAVVIQAVIVGGVFRLEIRPEEPAFLRLRLGRDELRLLVVWAIYLTGAWVAVWAAQVAARAAHVPGEWLPLLVAVLLVFLGTRFSLAAPITFAERRIDFLRSWRLSRGRTMALFGMHVLTLCLIGLVMVTTLLALALIATGSAGLEGLAGLFGGREALQLHPGLYALELGVEIVLTPVLWVLGAAPLIYAYRALTSPEGRP